MKTCTMQNSGQSKVAVILVTLRKPGNMYIPAGVEMLKYKRIVD